MVAKLIVFFFKYFFYRVFKFRLLKLRIYWKRSNLT